MKPNIAFMEKFARSRVNAMSPEDLRRVMLLLISGGSTQALEDLDTILNHPEWLKGVQLPS